MASSKPQTLITSSSRRLRSPDIQSRQLLLTGFFAAVRLTPTTVVRASVSFGFHSNNNSRPPHHHNPNSSASPPLHPSPPHKTSHTMLQPRSLRLLSSLSHCAPRAATASLSASLRCRTQRAYSIHADASVGTKIQDIDPTKLQITKTTTPKDLLPTEELIFGRNFSGASFMLSNAPGRATHRVLSETRKT